MRLSQTEVFAVCVHSQQVELAIGTSVLELTCHKFQRSGPECTLVWVVLVASLAPEHPSHQTPVNTRYKETYTSSQTCLCY